MRHTIGDDGVRPANPLAAKGQHDAGVLVLVFCEGHCDITSRQPASSLLIIRTEAYHSVPMMRKIISEPR